MKKRIDPLWISCFILSLFLFLLPAFLRSQQRNVTLQRIDVSQIPEIHLYFSVTDETGNSILGLTEEEILLTADEAPQVISSLKSALEGKEYLAVALLFDRSGSMKKALEQTKKAAINFVKRMSLDDQIAVISFDDIVRVDSNFSKDRVMTENAIRGIDLGKDTALYDAIKQALSLLQNTQTKRQAIVTLSDGKDTKSKLNKEEILLEAKNSGVPLFTLGLGANVDEKGLIDMSSETGGNFFKAASPEDLLLLYQTIAE
ncbi:VWA domain-containing protein, partial [Acidobacteriota bacterium]